MSEIPTHRILYEDHPDRLLPVLWLGDAAPLPAGWTVDEPPWGNCPVQASGQALRCLEWYFRARSGPWSFEVGADPVAGVADWWCIGPDTDYSGWMDAEDAWAAILDCIHGDHERERRSTRPLTPAETIALYTQRLARVFGISEEMLLGRVAPAADPEPDPDQADMAALAEWVHDNLGTGG